MASATLRETLPETLAGNLPDTMRDTLPETLAGNLPDTMRAIAIGADKTPDSLHIIDAPRPAPNDNEILVRVGAAGVNRGDCYQRMGLYPPPTGASDIMGLEFAGHVVACGAGVKQWKQGERIAALVAGGGYADYAIVHADHALPVPETMSLTQAAALPEVIFTVWANVMELGKLVAGETLLVHGGSSGIGTMAIQMAKLFAARIITTAATDAKCAVCKKLGADLAINYKQTDFVAAVDKFTQQAGADVILDMVGGDYFARNMAAAARGGRIVNIAHLQGSRAELDFLPIMLKNLTLTGSTLRARPIAEKARLTRAVAAYIWPHIGTDEKSAIQPVIDNVFPLAEAGAAQARMESSQHIGKIILDCEH